VTETAFAAWASWKIEWDVLTLLWVTGCIYTRGWLKLQTQMPQRFHGGKLTAFWAGLGILFVALASPLDGFGRFWLWAHMIQHLLLMLFAPFCLVWSAPMMPLLRGLPRVIMKDMLGPFLKWKLLKQIGRGITYPVFSWLALVITTWVWHAPGLYDLAVVSPGWHLVEHASFFWAGILFWWPVLAPWPFKPHWPRFAIIPYLVLVMLQNTALSALFVFSGKVLYPVYGDVPRIGGLDALTDQVIAGAIMWIPASLIFLIPVGVIFARALEPDSLVAPQSPIGPRTRPKKRVPWKGFASLASWRWHVYRPFLQCLMLALATLVVVDGLWGPEQSALNIAGVWPWVHWRGLLVFALLFVGNLFCMVCPFMLPRNGLRKILSPRLTWPKWARRKSLAMALLFLYLWSYEFFDLWDKPWLTAWIVLGYFVAAFVIDGLFKGATFCKYICPIGQFNFLHALLSPFEVKVREPAVCEKCTTHDCLKGNTKNRGCELDLFQPQKLGNLDCTFCMDCVKACPTQNVGILPGRPLKILVEEPKSPPLRQLFGRMDIGLLALFLVGGAFTNAAGMVDTFVTWPHLTFFLLLFPVIILAAAWTSLRMLGETKTLRETFVRFSLALLPLGFSMWLAHYGFHFLITFDSGWAVLQRAAGDAGFLMGLPIFSTVDMMTSMAWIRSMEIFVLDGGFVLSLYVFWRLAKQKSDHQAARFRFVLLPFCVTIGLYGLGVWTFLQPMQMRGMTMGG
jgi:cytochrome c oxidase assembly factor CtaG